MKIRLLVKVHYQVSRPGVFSIMLDQCTSPQQSNYPETVAKRLTNLKIKHDADSDFDSFQINSESAKFAVTMAQALGFLTSNCVWDWRGLSAASIVRRSKRKNVDQYLTLAADERIIYFKYFLESDGAALLEIGKRLLSWGPITRSDLLSPNNALINKAFIEIWEAYKRLTTDMRVRMMLSENIRGQKAKPYTYKTLIHKAQGHVFPMVDLGLIARRKSEANEVQFIEVTESGPSYLKNFVDALQNVENMERRLSLDQYFHVYAETFNIRHEEFIADKHGNRLLAEIVSVYRDLKPYSPPFVSIAAIADVVGVRMISRDGLLVERPDVEQTLDQVKNAYSRDFHFHVDRGGRRSFISISDGFLETFSSLA